MASASAWNEVEYEALGEDFHTRGRRCEEQIEVLRALWTQKLVTYKGKWHNITDAEIKPLPVQRPIPIWFGGRDERVLKRIARLGDGWFPLMPLGNELRDTLARLHQYMHREGRDPSRLGIDAWVSIPNRQVSECAKDIAAWKELGATHVSVNTMRAGLSFPKGHIDAIRRFKEVAADIIK